MIPSWLGTSNQWQNAVGPESFFLDQAEIVRHHLGWRVDVMMPEAKHKIKIRRRRLPPLRGIEITDLSFGGELWMGYYPYLLPRTARGGWRKFGETLFRAYIKKHGTPDAVWVQAIQNAGYLAMHLRDKFGIPYFIHEHAQWYASEKASIFRRLRTRKIANESLYCAAVSSNQREAMVQQLGISVEKLEVIHNPLNLQFDSTPPLPRNFNSERKNQFVFISVGRLVELKNFPALIDAFSQFARENSDARLIIAGDGPEMPRLRAQIESLGLRDSIALTGWLDKDTLRSQLLAADAFVAPSRMETFGISLVEAAAFGLPCASTKVGIAKDIISDESGVLLEGDSPEKILAGMKKIRANYSSYNSSAIRQRTMQMFSARAFCERLRCLLQSRMAK